MSAQCELVISPITSKQKDMNENTACSSRRNFIKGSAMATSALVLPSWDSNMQKTTKDEFIRRADESAIHLAYFDPAIGSVPNPGMGVNAYVFSDHIHVGYQGGEWNHTQGLPHLPLDKATFNRMMELPYVDNLYLRFEWRDVQKQQGKLELPEAWKWVLEAAEKHGKRRSFRIMNCSPHNMAGNSLPDFLQDRFKMIPYWHGDHVLIPAGTIHCSGKSSMVLEISATPYIFTFKLWDWGRLGMDGKPRPINIEHGKKVIQWDRTTEWTRQNLVNNIQLVGQGDGWIEERTGLHEREFIETRRHWFTKKIEHHTNGGVDVICLVEGDEVIVESPTNVFKPFVVHYAEVFIVPAKVRSYTIKPYGAVEGQRCGTMKGFVRF